MAVTKDEIKATFPLPVYNYKVEIDGVTIAFSEVSGLNIQYDTITYKESPIASNMVGPRVFYMPGQATATTITLKKGVVTGVSVQTLFAWINTIQLNQVIKKDIYVRLCDETGAAVVSWKVINAFPTKLNSPTFSATANEAAVETMELMADTILIEQA